MAGAMGIDNRDMQIGLVKRKVVVAPVPQDDVTALGIFFGRPHNGFVINTRIYHVAAHHMGFILFHFFDGTVVLLKVGQGCETLYFLGYEAP
jgi:hypothetical protein